MGLIKAALGAAGGVLADQWKEYFYCDALPETVLAVRGKKRVSSRSSNTKGSDNVISSGSVIAARSRRFAPSPVNLFMTLLQSPAFSPAHWASP